MSNHSPHSDTHVAEVSLLVAEWESLSPVQRVQGIARVELTSACEYEALLIGFEAAHALLAFREAAA